MVSCVVWDWNGTLLNDVDAAMQAMDRMLAARGLPLLGGVERYRELFTFPVREYYEAAGLDLDREPFEELAVEWTGLYRQTSRECGLFPGAEQVLEALGREGAVQLVVSASPQETLERQVAEQGIGPGPGCLCGGHPPRLGSGKRGGLRLRAPGAGPPEQKAFGTGGSARAGKHPAGAAVSKGPVKRGTGGFPNFFPPGRKSMEK